MEDIQEETMSQHWICCTVRLHRLQK